MLQSVVFNRRLEHWVSWARRKLSNLATPGPACHVLCDFGVCAGVMGEVWLTFFYFLFSC